MGWKKENILINSKNGLRSSMVYCVAEKRRLPPRRVPSCLFRLQSSWVIVSVCHSFDIRAIRSDAGFLVPPYPSTVLSLTLTMIYISLVTAFSPQNIHRWTFETVIAATDSVGYQNWIESSEDSEDLSLWID